MANSRQPGDHASDPLRSHAHDPNPDPPSDDPNFVLVRPDGREITLTVADLGRLPQLSVPNCYIVSTGHGSSGPFEFGGVALLDLVQSQIETPWSAVEVMSADGFGNRIAAAELHQPDPAGPVLLTTHLNGRLMTRRQGLVRMIVPNEKDDALRQVKWVGRVIVK
jgi:hypothetical protein